MAEDFIDHFHQRWKVVDTGGGKAMMVCLDKITCVKMHDLVKAKWQETTARLDAEVATEEALFAAKSKRQDARETPDVSELLQSLYEVVDTALATEGKAAYRVKGGIARYDLSNIDFARLRAEFERTPFKNVVTLFDQLNAFNSSLNEEEKRYLREGLDSEDQLAVFDLLQKASPTKDDRDAIKKVSRELLETLTGGKLRIDRWREKTTAQAQVKADIIKHLFTHLPPHSYDAEEINLKAGAVFAHLFTAGFSEGARVYR